MHIPFDNSYARLPDRFHARLDPTPVAAPRLVRLNTALAETLGIDPDELGGPDGVAVLAGNHVPPGAEPMALAYAGPPVRPFRAAARRRPRLSAGRGGRARRHAPRHPVERLRARRRFPAAATAGRRWGRCCAST